MVLAPYIQKSTALRGKYRFVGGNQFRHALGTFAILLDYHYMDPVLLKASIIHDVFEDSKMWPLMRSSILMQMALKFISW